MKSLLLFALALSLSSLLFAAPGDVVSTLPAPGRACTGLAFDGRNLWVADRLSDTLYALDTSSGIVMKRVAAPGFVPLGLAWDGKHLWCIDGEQTRICEMDVTSGLTVRSFAAPTSSPQALAWDGKNLWLADDREKLICSISADDGTTIVSYVAPSDGTSGLTYWNGYLWCADRRDDRIYLFDTQHGEVVFGMNAPGKFARGLASDGRFLWNVDYQSDSLYKLVMDDGQSVKSANPHTLDLLLTCEVRNYGPGEVTQLDAYFAVPGDLPNQKLIGDVRFTPSPLEIIRDRWQQPIAHFRLFDLPLAKREQIIMQVTAELSEARTFIFPHLVGDLRDVPSDVRKAYLVDEDKYRIHDPIIQSAVKAAVGDETNPYWMMRGIHKYIRDHLTYELAGGWNVAPKVLERGNGSCSEYTFVFISMCRAARIPARYVGSIVVRGDEASTDETFHRWSQVYLPPYGWVHVDPQGGDQSKPAQEAESIGVVGNRFLITTAGGAASEVLDWGYNHNQTWISRGPVRVHEEVVGEWSPAAAEPGH